MDIFLAVDYLRANGELLVRSARRGCKTAKAVQAAYTKLDKDSGDEAAQQALCDAVWEFQQGCICPQVAHVDAAGGAAEVRACLIDSVPARRPR